MRLTLLLLLLSCSLFAQSKIDTSAIQLTEVFSYEKVGNAHYFVNTVTNAEGNITINKVPFKSKKEVNDYVATLTATTVKEVETINKKIQEAKGKIAQMDEQLKLITDNVEKEKTKLYNEIRLLKTSEVLTKERKKNAKAL